MSKIIKLFKVLILLSILGGAGYVLFRYILDRNQFFQSVGLPTAYSEIEVKVTELQKKESNPDIYLLTLGLKNLPPEKGIHLIEVILWNREQGAVRYLEARNIMLNEPELSLLFNVPFTVTERELNNTDSVQLIMRKEGKVVYVDEVDFDPRQSLRVPKDSYYFRRDNSLLHLERISTVRDLEAKMNTTVTLEENRGYAVFSQAEDYTGVYLRRTKLPYDMIFLDSTFKVVDLQSELAATAAIENSPYIESRGKSQVLLVVPSGWVTTHNIGIGDVFVYY